MEIFNYFDESEIETLENVFPDNLRGLYLRSDETRAKVALATKSRSREQKLAYGRAATAARIANGNCPVGEKNAMYGKKHTAEARAKISKAFTGRTHSDDTRQRMSETRKNKSTIGYSWHTPFGVFATSSLAAEAEGITPSGIRARCKHETLFPDYFKKLDN